MNKFAREGFKDSIVKESATTFKHSDGWGTGTDSRKPYELGIHSSKHKENNSNIATMTGVGTAMATGGTIGGTIKGITGQPAHKTFRNLIQRKPLGISKHLRDSGITQAGKDISKATSGGPKEIARSTLKGIKNLNYRKILPQAAAGAAGAAGILGGLTAASNKTKYEMGRAVANSDRK